MAWLDEDGEPTQLPATFPELDVSFTAKYRTADTVVELNGEYYTSLTDALKAAQPGDTVTLAADIVGEDFTVVNADVTPDLRGHSITGGMMIYATGKNKDSMTTAETKGSVSADAYMMPDGQIREDDYYLPILSAQGFERMGQQRKG